MPNFDTLPMTGGPASNMDLLTQAITQRPRRSTSPPPTFQGQARSSYNRPQSSRREVDRRSTSPPQTTGNGENRAGAARRNAILSQINHLESEFIKKKDRYCADQLRQLQEDLSRLHDGTHADFNTGCADLMDIRNEALYIAREEGLGKLRLAEADYERETESAREEYEKSRASLKNDLLTHLQAKKRKLETDKTLSDISLSTTLEAPPSPSLHTIAQAGSRKLRHRLPLQQHVSNYPSPSLSTKSPLDEALETLAETVKTRHWKHNQQPQNEERVRDRIEREREKMVRAMLVGATQQEADADVNEMKRKYIAKKGLGAGNALGLVNVAPKKVKS